MNIMNIRNEIFAFALFALAFASCNDDDRHADEPVVDDYRGSQSVLTMTDETASLSTSDIELIILTPDGSEIRHQELSLHSVEFVASDEPYAQHQ